MIFAAAELPDGPYNGMWVVGRMDESRLGTAWCSKVEKVWSNERVPDFAFEKKDFFPNKREAIQALRNIEPDIQEVNINQTFLKGYVLAHRNYVLFRKKGQN